MLDQNLLGSETPLFLRKATGLVREWKTYDTFVYSALSINIVTLGFYAFTFEGFLPGVGNLLTATLVSAIFIFFLIVTYAALIAVMPRSGGDYVWQSRIATGSIGFILGITGYVFILWHWAPIYGNILSIMVFTPIAAVLGNSSAAFWWSTPTGIFWSSIITVIFVFGFVAVGLGWYARIQKWAFHIGMAGLIVMFALMVASSNSTFQNGFNSMATKVFGTTVTNAYSNMTAFGSAGGVTGKPLFSGDILGSFPLIPIIAFFNLYPVWGATLYGEVRGANDFKRNLKALTTSLIFTTLLCVIFFVLVANTFGWDFFNSANYVYWNLGAKSPFPIFPYPGLFAALLTNNIYLQLFILLALSAFYWGWSGTLFMTSTRVLFAASFDRELPSWIADVSTRFKTPLKAIVVMAIPSAILSYVYSFVTFPGGIAFSTFVLDAVVVIAVMYLGTAVVATILPWRRPQIYNSSPISTYKVGGIPAISIAGAIFAAFMIYLLWAWAAYPAYGVNNPYSFYYMLILYLIAGVVYFAFKFYRKSQGIDMNKLYAEIPVE
jgi:APA family basic amino acid/polyamine antiporter